MAVVSLFAEQGVRPDLDAVESAGGDSGSGIPGQVAENHRIASVGYGSSNQRQAVVRAGGGQAGNACRSRGGLWQVAKIRRRSVAEDAQINGRVDARGRRRGETEAVFVRR